LVFIPGFNSWLDKSLNTLGQFLAMTNITEHVVPVLFDWPNGTVLTYRHASVMSHSDRNKENFLALMRGLAEAGIRHVHFLSHSMGAQTLLAAFADDKDGNRSEVSKCFQLMSSFDGDLSKGSSSDMTCKSMTLVNPDFPIESFISHVFPAIRRVCDHITIVGDRSDQALKWSQVINGLTLCLGYEQPWILNPQSGEAKNSAGMRQQLVVGRDIESIYMRVETTGKDDSEAGSKHIDDRLLFADDAPVVTTGQRRLWLDVDVIDTTALDTNIKDLRHSGFNVNPILLNDLEELIVTGRRASERSILLHREGNLYSYCHAPAFITM
jgi:hypothetical protein